MNPDYKNISETRLIDLLLKKDKAAFEYVYDKYGNALFGVISKIIVDDAVAEEVLQDAFLEIWTKITLYDRTKGGLITWMLNISRNLALEKAKSEHYNKDKKIDKNKNKYIFDLNNVIDEKAGDAGVEGLMQGLSPDQKMIIELLYFKGYTPSEVALEYNIPLDKVKTLLRSALIRIRKTLS